MPLPFPFTNFDGPSPVYLANFLTGTLPSGVTVSSPSLGGLVTDSTGKLTYKPNNLLLNSATLSTQSITTTIGVNYIISFYGTGTVTLSGAATNVIVGTGVGNQVYANITATTTSLTLTVVGSVTSAVTAAVTYETSPRSGDQVITTSSAYYGPAFDYDPVTLQPLGLRIWEQRTNVFLQSSVDYATNGSWSVAAGGYAVSVGGQAAPDGTNSAFKIIPSTSNQQHYFYQVPAYVAGTPTISIHAKAAGYSKIGLFLGTSVNAQAWFDISTGTVGTVSGTAATKSATIVPLGNGEYRCELSATQNSGNPASGIITGGNVEALSFAGDGTSGAILWGAQFENASFTGPYIPTGSAAVTAAADVVNIPSPTWLSSTQGTFVVSADTSKSSGQSAGIFVASDGTPSNRIILAQMATNANLEPFMVAGGVLQADLASATGTLANTRYRTAIAYGAGRVAASSNGGAVVSATGTIPTMNQIGLGYYYPGLPGSNYLDGHIQGFAYYNSRLPDATLKAKSVVGAPY